MMLFKNKYVVLMTGDQNFLKMQEKLKTSGPLHTFNTTFKWFQLLNIIHMWK